jgi:hypothetical protein
MKATASRTNTTTQQQKKNSRLQDGPGAAKPQRTTSAGASASDKATARARNGEPLKADTKKDRSPKQENL